MSIITIQLKRTLVKAAKDGATLLLCPKGGDTYEVVAKPDLLALVPFGEAADSSEKTHWAYTTIRYFPGYGIIKNYTIDDNEDKSWK